MQPILMHILLMITFLSLFEEKTKLLGNTAAQPAPNAANGIQKNATISVALKYLSNF